jgi:hygromycin-B 4-O-kinase
MQITPDILTPFLTRQFQAEITGIEPVRGGEWSQAFFFSAKGQGKVIRFSEFDEDFKKDRFAARFSSPNLPVPQIEEIGEAFGLFFAISPRVGGKMIDQFSATEMREALPALMDLLNALREVEGSQTRGYGGFGADGNGTTPSWRDFITRMTPNSPQSRLRGWKENLARYKEAQEAYHRGRQSLLELVPLCPEERHLVHNDLLHFNLIMKEGRVAAVIDWGCALWGDFLYDLAIFTSWQFYYPAMAGIDFAAEALKAFTAKNVSLLHFDERLQCYQLHLLLDTLAYNAWKEDRSHLEITLKRLKEIL